MKRAGTGIKGQSFVRVNLEISILDFCGCGVLVCFGEILFLVWFRFGVWSYVLVGEIGSGVGIGWWGCSTWNTGVFWGRISGVEYWG